MKRTFLVTGGAGFIGSHVIDRLLEKNHKVICIDNFNSYYSPNTKEHNIKEHLLNSNYRLYRADLADTKYLAEVFSKENITDIIHLAARAGVRPSISEPLEYSRSNITGTINLLEFAKKYDIKNFVFASSSSVYGSKELIAFNEEMKINKPISPYAATKAAGEQICYTYSHLFDTTIKCLRFFTVYGPRQRPDLAIHKFTKLIDENKEIQIYGDGTSLRDYTYIDDIVSGILAAVDYNKTKFEIFNLGNSNTVKLNYLVDLLQEKLHKKAQVNYIANQSGDVPITFADINKAKTLLNYNPQTKIENGLDYFINWYYEAKKFDIGDYYVKTT